MATYLPGITDYIPQVQPFKPDLNFYNTVLQTKQSQQDAAMQQIGNLYGSILYAPLTAKDNIKRRDDFFKMIEQDLHKISGMDLSLPENVAIAESLFNPILEDKAILHDMAYTRSSLDERQRGEGFKYCADPKECGGEYWEQGLQYIDLNMQEYDKASQDQRYKMSAPQYHPKVNLMEMAWKWADDAGIVVEAVSSNGDYFITRQNGQQMLIPLQYIFSSLYGDDPKVKGMYNVEAYLQRKTYIEQNKGRFNNNEDLAEKDWFNAVLSTTGQKLLEKQKMAEGAHAYARYKKGYLENALRAQGLSRKYGKDDPRYKDFMAAMQDEQLGQVTNEYYKGLITELNSLKNDPSNMMLFRSKIDNIVSAGLIEENIGTLAGLYADTHSAVTGIEEDQFKLEFMKHKYGMERDAAKIQLEYEKDLKLKMFDMTADMYTFMYNGGGSINASPVPINADPDQIAVHDNPFGETYQTIISGAAQRDTAQTAYLKTLVDRLNEVIGNENSNPKSIEYAKKMKQNIFGSNYDPNTNMFKNGSNTNVDWSKLNFDPKAINDFYKNGLNAVRQNDGLFNDGTSTYTRLKDLETAYSLGSAKVEGTRNIYLHNSDLIWRTLNSNVDIKDKAGFAKIFKKDINNYYHPMSEAEYVKANSNNPKARAEYQKQMANFKQIYNKGSAMKYPSHTKESDRFKTLDGLTITESGYDGGKLNLAKMEFKVNAGMPLWDGTMALNSLRSDMKGFDPTGAQKKGYLGVTYGDRFTKGEDDGGVSSWGDLDNFSNPDDKSAEKLAWYFLNDFDKQYSTKEDKKLAPAGVMYYKNTAGGRANVEAYHIIPSREWLMSYADKNNMTGKLYERTIDDWATNGFVIYKDKSTSNSALTKQYSTHPYDALIRSGTAVKINRDNAADVTIRKENNKIIVSGNFTNLEKLPDGSLRTVKVPIGGTGSQEYDDYPGFSPGKLYSGILQMSNALYSNNYGMKYRNEDDMVQGAEFDAWLQQEVRNAQLREGLSQPTMSEKLAKSYQDRMGYVQEMFKMMNNVGY